jgi:peptidyl-prolyl cis-trans isomerase C
MVKEFDEVVFSDEIGKTHGPIKTQFGYHLLEILNRND